MQQQVHCNAIYIAITTNTVLMASHTLIINMLSLKYYFQCSEMCPCYVIMITGPYKYKLCLVCYTSSFCLIFFTNNHCLLK